MGRQDFETETLIAHSLRAEGFDASEDGTGRGTPLVPVTFAHQQGGSHDLHFARDRALAITRHQGQAVAFNITPSNSNKDFNARESERAQALTAGGNRPSARGGDVITGFQASQSGFREVDTHATLDANNGSRRHNGVAIGSAVRRLTPRECERLQGFRDDFTLVPHRGKPMADGPRYKMLGNSMAVPVLRWIGERIQMVDAIASERCAA